MHNVHQLELGMTLWGPIVTLGTVFTILFHNTSYFFTIKAPVIHEVILFSFFCTQHYRPKLGSNFWPVLQVFPIGWQHTYSIHLNKITHIDCHFTENLTDKRRSKDLLTFSSSNLPSQILLFYCEPVREGWPPSLPLICDIKVNSCLLHQEYQAY